jgi:hypothetical protein
MESKKKRKRKRKVKKKTYQKKLSLYPMTFEEVVDKVLNVKRLQGGG